MAESNNNLKLSQLIIELLDGSIDNDRLQILNECLSRSPEALNYYREFMKNTAVLKQRIYLTSESGQEHLSPDLWSELANYEKMAPAIEAPIEEMPRELIQKVVYPPREKRKISKFQIFTLITSAAAIFFFVLLLKVAPPKLKVATLSDSFDAVWAEKGPIKEGQRLVAGGEKLFLRAGLVQLRFDNNARVTIEAPAEFQIVADDRISLNYGKVYVVVPRSAIGFSVYTQSAKIVDMGTEFGVQADSQETELHVMKGKTMLIPSSGDSSEDQFEVHHGQAKTVVQQIEEGQAKIASRDGSVRDIPLKEEAFVRVFDSKNHFIWRGQNKIDLADIIDGGNGFGTGRTGTCIDPATGRIGPYKSMPDRSTQDNYNQIQSFVREVKDLPGIDCVIVPSRKGGVLPITTTGLSVSEFPELLGDSRWLIQTRTHNETFPFVLNGTTYGVNDCSGFSMHATCGITFDLNKIRQNVPGIEVVSFKTLCGLNDSRLAGNVDPDMTGEIYVFLDGEQVYHHVFVHVENNAVPIEIDLKKDNPRFMTLVVSCGRDDNKLDWFIFGEPILVLER